MRIDELLTEEEKGFFKGVLDKIMGSGSDKDFEEYMARAKYYKYKGMSDNRVKSILTKEFPNAKPVDIVRAMKKVGYQI